MTLPRWGKPIPAASPVPPKAMAVSVERIVSAKQRDAGTDTSALEWDMGRLVCKLRSLTPNEIKLVEDSAR